MQAISFFLKRKDTKHQKCKRGKHLRGQARVTNICPSQLPMKAGWGDTPLELRDLAEPIPIIGVLSKIEYWRNLLLSNSQTRNSE